MHYLGRKFEDEFISVVIKLDYPILSQEIDEISAVAMWQESNISRKLKELLLVIYLIFR